MIKSMNKTQVLDTPKAIDGFRTRMLRSALKLEVLGMTRRGRSVFSVVKEEFGFKGNKQQVLDQLLDYIKENNLKVDYLFYITNQIMKPSIQFLSLLTDEAEDIFNKIINDEKEIRNLRNNKSKNKRRIKMLNKKNKKSIKIIDNWFKNENQTDSESGSSGTESNSDSESEEDKNIKKVRKVKKKSKFALFL